jgi:hypothetical protein
LKLMGFRAERGNLGEQFIGQSFGLSAKLGNGVAEVDETHAKRARDRSHDAFQLVEHGFRLPPEPTK